MSSSFTPEQVQTFNQIASGQFASDVSYAEEVNARRMESFLKGSIYSSKNNSDQTKKVIREVLQNAVDATTKKGRNDPAHRPQVKLYFSLYGEEYQDSSYMDMTVIDNGVGMDLQTLSQNFYVYFQSGKEEEQDSTGGFGIAKAVIQETPAEGWSLESNDIGSSSFHKNMYMGTKLQNQYQHPGLEIKREGTQLSLYHIPSLYMSSIKDICSKYATGDVDIYLNDELVEPIFDFSTLHKVDATGDGIVDAIAANAVEEDMARNVVQDKQQDLTDSNVGGYSWNVRGENGEDQFIKVDFYVMKVPDSDYGKVYVRLNGQYQYEDSYIPQCNIICEIKTNTRPNEPHYPMDPGRENLRSPVKETVDEAVKTLEKLIKDITDNEIFKEGLDIFIYNKDKNPITTAPKDVWEQRERQSRFIERMESVGVASASLFEQEEVSGSEASQVLEEMAEALHPEMSGRQQAMLTNVAQAFSREKSKMDTTDFVNDVIEMLETPCEVVVQKNFVSDAVAHDDIDLTSTLAVLWQKVLKIVIDGSKGFIRGEVREFIPGLIYSDKAIALYAPRNPKIGRNYDTISINPMYVASIVKPDLFEDYLAGKSSGEMEDERESITKDETPINRLSVFLFHEAVHEITHLLFPEYYAGNYDKFHSWVTKLENVNHFNFPLVRSEVKRFMPQLKKDTDKLIRRIKKDKKRMGNAEQEDRI